ncbi:hypothetical protein [Nocardioides sp. GXZ039]|uniref:hypothetical protein n=1 Tax=Nocardioides sp. GXZ039 TaxID=3136018 RepID=UPI0030F41EEF
MSRAGDVDVLSLSVHGPVGVLDLQVPAEASGIDVATEYSRQTNLPGVPVLYTRLGRPLPPEGPLADLGVVTGAVLVADLGGAPVVRRGRTGSDGGQVRRLTPGPLSALWCAVAAVAAILGGWLAASLPESSDLREITIIVLIATAAVGALPVGPLAAHRVVAVPAFAGAAAFAIAWDPAPERLPTILGVSGLAAAVAAAVARTFDQPGEESLRVWMIAGVSVFLVTGLAALADVDSQVVWALLLLVAMLAARFVPVIAVDVPDQYLLDLERLAVTAWSARERPSGRRRRIVVPHQAVTAVVARGARLVTAACVAILVIGTVSAVMLLQEATVWIDLIGARLEVLFAGGGLLLAARSYRHAAARALLRIAGLGCWAALLVAVVPGLGPTQINLLSFGALAIGALLVLVGVAAGRGWRSAWWSRRAEVAEGICGAFAVGSLVLAAGFFRVLWEITG